MYKGNPKHTELKAGHLLVAEPFMLDPNFKRSVVLLCDHQADGSFGFVLNKPLQTRLNELVLDFPDFSGPLFDGGPVQRDAVSYVHNVGNMLEGSLPVRRGLWMGGDFEKLKFLIEREMIGPENIRFFLGYSGWGEGQLGEELELGSWIVAEGDPNYVFRTHHTELWQRVLEHKGGGYGVIGHLPDEESMN